MSESESEILAQIVEYLRTTGWDVHVFSVPQGTYRQLADWPDVVAFRYAVTLLIEAKSATGKRTPGQVAFAQALEPHLGPTLRYVLARSVQDVEACSGGR